MKPGRGQNVEEVRDFDLKSVCWGYRHIFRKTIEKLYERNLLGSHRKEVTDHVFDLLNRADQSCFDHVLKEFLASLNRRNQWLLDLPSLFNSITSIGRQLAEMKLQYGIDFFRQFGEGRLGETPRQVENVIKHVSRLKETDGRLALEFIKGYKVLLKRLNENEIPLYVEQGLQVFRNNRETGLEFMKVRGPVAENFIRSLTRECRLEEVRGRITSLMRALTGMEFTVDNLGGLDSDHLIERGSTVVCLGHWLFLPASIRYFDDRPRNMRWYMLMALSAAGATVGRSFCTVHGRPGYVDCASLVDGSPLRVNLFQITEYIRVFDMIFRRWPGAEKLLRHGLEVEFCEKKRMTSADRVLRRLLYEKSRNGGMLIHELAGRAADFEDSARFVNDYAEELSRENPGLDADFLSPLSFIPDPMFPAEPGSESQDRAAEDFRNEGLESEEGSEFDGPVMPRLEERGGQTVEETETGAQEGFCYAYDEWSISQNAYRKDYCSLYEIRPQDARQDEPGTDLRKESERVSRFFERIKPELMRREKRLSQGDYINIDLLIEYLILKRNEPSPEIRFYEKPYIETRDMAVSLLLDVSGSTAEDSHHARTIDTEKNAAFALAGGLDSLGDPFALSGFSSNGRDRCEYYTYKDFGEPWDKGSMGRLLSARPINATRMGAALRHAAYWLSKLPNRRKLILLITDGKPMDQDYDSRTGYAQADVRKACEENRRMGIETYAVCTQEDSAADMEFMFPAHRFVTLKGIGRLPRVLPKLYMKLTV